MRYLLGIFAIIGFNAVCYFLKDIFLFSKYQVRIDYELGRINPNKVKYVPIKYDIYALLSFIFMLLTLPSGIMFEYFENSRIKLDKLAEKYPED